MSDYTDFTKISLLRQNWQQRSFDIYDAEGHLFYATNYIGGAMARIQLVGATKPKNHGNFEQPEILTTGPVADAIASIESPLSGQSGFLRQIGKNIFLTGESWIIASTETYPDGSSQANWDAVSVDELVAEGGKQKRRRLPGQQPEDLPPGAVTFRIWKEHPRFSELADSGVRSCMELLEKIITLNRAEKAIARSQLAGSGILALPQELVPPAWQNQATVGNPMDANPLWQALAESMLAPLADESAPSAVMPLLLVGPGEIIKNIKYEPMKRSFDSAGAQASIRNAIDQIANTLEIPKEILLGIGQSTHWTAWAIHDDVFQAHIKPLIELVCAGLTRTFMKQALAKFSDAELKANGIENRDDVIVWYDASQLVAPPDKIDKMLGLHDRFIVTDEAVAEVLSVPVDQRLDHKSMEYKTRVGVKLADAKMAIDGTPTDTTALAREATAPKGTNPIPASGVGAGGGGGPKGYSPSRGKSPQGPNSSPAKLPSERRAKIGLPQDSKTLTASSYSRANALGHFDLSQMKIYRDMAERHVRKALVGVKSMTASADPGDFILDEMITEFANAAALTWEDARAVMYDLFGSLESPLYDSTVQAAIRESVDYYRQLLRGLVDKYGFPTTRTPIYGEFNVGGLVQYGDVRPLLVKLGGGPSDQTVPLTGGVTSGETMSNWLSNNGIQTEYMIWLYGLEEQPRRVFNGHLQMDGLIFQHWEDEALDVAPQDAWLRTDHYYPGDHFGCSCVVAPHIPNLGDEFNLEIPQEDSLLPV